MASFYVFSISLLFIVYQTINSQSTTLLLSITPIVNVTDNVTLTNQTDETPLSTTLFFNTTIAVTTNVTFNSSNITITTNLTTLTTTLQSTILLNTTSIGEMTTSNLDRNQPSNSPSKPGWWLLIALIITIAAVSGIGLLYYHNQTPYKRFLRNWRARDNEADNIILQLEQPEITNSHWPHRISFA